VSVDDITRDRSGVKYLWLMYVRQRTKWISTKLMDVDGSISPFAIVLKSSITNRLNSSFIFCKKKTHSVVHYLIFLCLFYDIYSFPRSKNLTLVLRLIPGGFPYLFQLFNINIFSPQFPFHFPNLGIS